MHDTGDAPLAVECHRLVRRDILQAPTPDSENEATTAGATVRIWNPLTLEEATFALPAGASWKALGNPPGSNGYRY